MICWFGFARVPVNITTRGKMGLVRTPQSRDVYILIYNTIHLYVSYNVLTVLSISWLRLPLKDGLMVYAVCGCGVRFIHNVYVIHLAILSFSYTAHIHIQHNVTCCRYKLGNETANGNFPSFHIITAICIVV